MEEKSYEAWITKEINIVIEQLKTMTRYQKARHEGYLSALKKVQAKIQAHAKGDLK